MHPYQLENWCVQWERKRRGKAVSYTNEGDGIKAKSARAGGRERGPVPDLPLSHLRARLLKSHRRSNISRDGCIVIFYFLITGIKDSNRLISHNLTFNAIDVETSRASIVFLLRNVKYIFPHIYNNAKNEILQRNNNLLLNVTIKTLFCFHKEFKLWVKVPEN